MNSDVELDELRARSDALQIRLAVLGVLAMFDWALAYWAIQSEMRWGFIASSVIFVLVCMAASVAVFRLSLVRASMKSLRKSHSSVHRSSRS